MMYLVVKLPCL